LKQKHSRRLERDAPVVNKRSESCNTVNLLIQLHSKFGGGRQWTSGGFGELLRPHNALFFRELRPDKKDTV